MIDVIGIDEMFKDVENWVDTTDELVQQKVRHGISLTINQLGEQVKIALSNTDLNINSPMPEGGTLYQGISQYMWKKDTNQNFSVGVINILGNRQENDGTWRLRFFEAGTKERKQKSNGKKLGAIEGRWFFDTGTRNVDAILRQNIDTCLEEAANINNSKQ